MSLSLLHSEKPGGEDLHFLFTYLGTRQEKIGVLLCILARRQRRGNNEEREKRVEVITGKKIVLSQCQVLINNFLVAEKKGRKQKRGLFKVLVLLWSKCLWRNIFKDKILQENINIGMMRLHKMNLLVLKLYQNKVINRMCFVDLMVD